MAKILSPQTNIRIWVSLGIAAVALVFCLWLYSKHHPATEDAYIHAHIIQVAAQVNGPIAKIYVDEHQRVKQGDLLLEIDPAPYLIGLDQARAQLRLIQEQVNSARAAVAVADANLIQRQAELKMVEKNTRRIMTLVNAKQLPLADGDNAQGKLQSAQASMLAAVSSLAQARSQVGGDDNNNSHLQQAQAQLAQAELNLRHTKIYAASDGVISNCYLRAGTMIGAGKPLFALIEDKDWWVDANFKETDIKRIRVGQPVVINIDIYPHKKFKGKVVAIGTGSTATFSLLPAEDASGNWVKVTQRFPVRISITNDDPQFPLRVGASTSVKIST